MKIQTFQIKNENFILYQVTTQAKNQYSAKAGAVPLGQTNDINNHIIDELQKLQKFRQQTGSHWEEIANRKAIANIRKYPKKIESGAEARTIPGVGEKIAEHVKQTNHKHTHTHIHPHIHTHTYIHTYTHIHTHIRSMRF